MSNHALAAPVMSAEAGGRAGGVQRGQRLFGCSASANAMRAAFAFRVLGRVPPATPQRIKKNIVTLTCPGCSPALTLRQSGQSSAGVSEYRRMDGWMMDR